jgi:hypothetical protein
MIYALKFLFDNNKFKLEKKNTTINIKKRKTSFAYA